MCDNTANLTPPDWHGKWPFQDEYELWRLNELGEEEFKIALDYEMTREIEGGLQHSDEWFSQIIPIAKTPTLLESLKNKESSFRSVEFETIKSNQTNYYSEFEIENFQNEMWVWVIPKKKLWWWPKYRIDKTHKQIATSPYKFPNNKYLPDPTSFNSKSGVAQGSPWLSLSPDERTEASSIVIKKHILRSCPHESSFVPTMEDLTQIVATETLGHERQSYFDDWWKKQKKARESNARADSLHLRKFNCIGTPEIQGHHNGALIFKIPQGATKGDFIDYVKATVDFLEKKKYLEFSPPKRGRNKRPESRGGTVEKLILLRLYHWFSHKDFQNILTRLKMKEAIQMTLAQNKESLQQALKDIRTAILSLYDLSDNKVSHHFHLLHKRPGKR